MSETVQPLISECPACRTRFQVTEEQLSAAEGRVRCGACLTVFQGRNAAVAPGILKKDPATVSQGAEPGALKTLLGFEEPVGTQAPVTGELGDSAVDRRSADRPPVSAPAAPKEPPSGVAKSDSAWSAVVMATLVAAMAALLAAGVLTLQFGVWSQHRSLRGVYEAAGIDLPPYKALDAIRVTDLSVPNRPGPPNPIVVHVDLANTAPQHQRFPALAVRLQAANGVTLAEQRIEPEDYLPTATHSRRMTPNSAVNISLRLDDPGAEAVSYVISLL